jgi:ferritin
MSMINAKVQKALNKQINAELFAAYSYAAMAADMEHKNFDGMAGWLRIQAQEEVTHAMRIYSYLLDAGARVTFDAIAKPRDTFGTPLDLFEEAYKHERDVTQSIYKLVELSQKEADYATETLLRWFVTEQVEEEKNASHIVERLRMVGDSPQGLLLIDRELGSRTAEAG